MVDEEMLPEQYDQVYIVSLLVALYGLQDRISKKGYARGGLSVAARQLAAQGRGGDTELAHVNPREAAMLRRAGGSGTINPNTGLREYKSWIKKIKWGKVLAAVAPVVLGAIIPGVGGIIGSALTGGLLGSASTGAIALGGAALGAASSAIAGGNPLMGAVTGGIGAGLGDVLGGGINSGLNLGLSEGMANALGNAVAGAGAATVQGRDPLTGAITGAIGSGISGMGGLGIENPAISQVVADATRGFGRAITAGQSPSDALTAGGLSALGGVASGLMKNNLPSLSSLTSSSAATPAADTTNGAAPAASDASPVASYDFGGEGNQQIATGVAPTADASTTTAAMPTLTGVSGLGAPVTNPAPASQFGPGSQFFNDIYPDNTVPVALDAQGYPLSNTIPPEPPGESGSTLGRLGPLLAGGAALAALSGMGSSKSAPPAVQSAIRNLSPTQQEYFNRPSIVWDWDKLSADAASSNLSLDQFMAQNWNRVSGGEYNKAPAMAQGGLNAMSRFVRGGGTGRSDEIDAKLSDGEYVIDAETVAMLGDGSSKAGAKRLDEMRAEIRKHKGKTLARGKFSPDAKSPLTYLKGVA
jgi:hypothetical protein